MTSPAAKRNAELAAACIACDVAKARQLIKQDKYDVNSHIHDAPMLLHVCSHVPADPDKIEEIVDLLLESGAKLNCVHRKQKTNVLHVSYHTPQLLECLIDRIGADDSGCNLSALLEAHDKVGPGFTPLHHACLSALSVESVRLLLDAGANMEAKCEKGETALMKACWHPSFEVAQLLIDRGADVSAEDNTTKVAERYCPLNIVEDGLHVAHYADAARILKLLKEHGAELPGKSKKKTTTKSGAAAPIAKVAPKKAAKKETAKEKDAASATKKTQSNGSPKKSPKK